MTVEISMCTFELYTEYIYGVSIMHVIYQFCDLLAACILVIKYNSTIIALHTRIDVVYLVHSKIMHCTLLYNLS